MEEPISQSPGPPLPPQPPQPSLPPQQPPLTPYEERTWAMLAHLSILVNLISAFMGVVAALVIYLVYKDRSRYVAYHSLQSVVFQLVFWVGGGALVGAGFAITWFLTVIGIGCLLIPFATVLLLVPMAAVIYGVIGGIQCGQGQDFKYWLVGDWVRGMGAN